MKRVLAFLIILFWASTAFPVENLDEMVSRKDRHATASWGYQYLENSSSNYWWQPETLCYFDVTTGREVWRMTSTASEKNYYRDIGYSPWSADGKRMGFASSRNTGSFNTYGGEPWMIVNTDGRYIRPLPNAPARLFAHTPQMHWSPILPDVYYEFGRNYALEGLNDTDLYKVTVSDSDVSKSLLISFPVDHDQLELVKTISANGAKVLAVSYVQDWWYPATVYPDGSAGLDDADGYSSHRDMDSTWGDTKADYGYLHDQYYVGDGSWIFALQEGTHAWWRLKILGTATDGGSVYSFSAPDTFGEQWPENAVDWFGGTNDPFGCVYWSHVRPDMWGHYVVFSSNIVGTGSTGVWNVTGHEYVIEGFLDGYGCEHHDWSAWSDHNITSHGKTTDVSPEHRRDDRVYWQKYNDINSRETVAYLHVRYNDDGAAGGAYEALPRPTESPDGTKIAFHSTFLNTKVAGETYDDRIDLFWTVAEYPHPPEMTQASKNGENVRLQFEWMLDGANPRGYTTRGWPDEAVNDPPPPREIAWFIIWRSADGSTWEYVTKVANPVWSNYNFSTGVWSGVDYVTADIAQNVSTTMYYAITSRETSGLESRTLSNVWKVTLDGGGTITTQEQQTAYPSDPGGSSTYGSATFSIADSAPSDPTDLSVTYCGSGDCSAWTGGGTTPDQAGQVLLTWTAPADTTLIRYYNIYALDGSAPTELQTRLIASIPASAGLTQYLDCFGSATTQYAITSVDYWGRGAQGQPYYRAVEGVSRNGVIIQ